MKIFKNSKAALSFEIVIMLAALVMAAVGIMMGTNVFDKAGEETNNQFLGLCSASLDGEGPYKIQELAGDCPCDIDDETNDRWYGKMYTVRDSIRQNEATKIFNNKMYLSKFNYEEGNRMRISEYDVEEISEYIEDKTSDIDAASLELSGQLIIHYNDDLIRTLEQNKPIQPDLQIFCPSLGKLAENSCTPKQFIEDWFDEKFPLECRTSPSECKERLIQACEDE